MPTNHLLAAYPVPEFMATAWLRDDDNDGPACRELWFHIAAGNNPRTGKPPVAMSRRVAHHFLQAPAHYTIEGAVRWGQIAALGGSPALADACVATRLGEHFGNDAFWLSSDVRRRQVRFEATPGERMVRVMAKKNGSARFVQHLQSLGFETVDGYLEWCREHGFEANTRKPRAQVCREVAQVRKRQCRALLATPRPVEIDWVDWLRHVIDGTRTVHPAREEQVFKKRQVWLSMPEEWRWGLRDKTRAADRGALLELVDVVGARARFLLEGEETAGHRYHYYATGFFNLAACRRQWRRPLADWRPHSRDRRSEFSSLCNHLRAEYPVPAIPTGSCRCFVVDPFVPRF